METEERKAVNIPKSSFQSSDGAKIDSYMAADLEIIGSLNDAVGGVAVTIPTLGMEQADPEFVFGQTVRLDGEQAERFVRFRDTGKTILLCRVWNSRSFTSADFSSLSENGQKSRAAL